MPLALGLIGAGLVGGELLCQIASQWPILQKERRAQHGGFVVAGIANSKRMLLLDDGCLHDWKEKLACGAVVDLQTFLAHLQRIGAGGGAAVVDCTSSAVIAAKYPELLHAGIHVVTPNKKAFSGDIQLWTEIQQIQRRCRVWCMHEASVGAGLPIISTIDNLICQPGDAVVRVEGMGQVNLLIPAEKATEALTKR